MVDLSLNLEAQKRQELINELVSIQILKYNVFTLTNVIAFKVHSVYFIPFRAGYLMKRHKDLCVTMI